jgi:hypothetical protein
MQSFKFYLKKTINFFQKILLHHFKISKTKAL